MKARNLLLLSSASFIFATAQAEASFVGLSAILYRNDGQGHDIYRVYADFTSPADTVIIAGAFEGHSMDVEILSSFGHPDWMFYNPGGAAQGNTAPSDPALANGTYVTIGIDDPAFGSLTSSSGEYRFDATTLSAGFPNFIANSADFQSTDAFWYTSANIQPGGQLQGAAAWINSGIDTDHRTMLMQLAVPENTHVIGFLSIGYIDGQSGLTVTAIDQNFFGVPSPAALPFLALSALFASRRRRR
ncbi:MAG TPA: hypothetical protein VG711_04895 [Phycisphaerales bacterium]|nr:hypothetical protein [Phycisphaerales bacterium]